MTKNDTCGSRTGREWFRLRPQHSPKCHLQLLRRYFNINRTHTLGKPCSSTDHVALHVRSGDVARGGYGQDGKYNPSGVHQGYGLYPTAYYTSVMREIRTRRDNSPVTFFVFCETMGNPSCEFFEKLSALDENVVMRVNQTLIDDLRLMLCASEVAVSHGTFAHVFSLPLQPQIIHTFSSLPGHNNRSCQKVWHWMENSELRANFENVTKVWKNTGFQRHEVDAAYVMNHTEVVC